jgi:hypothetical protein
MNLENKNYIYVPPLERVRLGNEVVEALKKQGCNPGKVFFTITNKKGNPGFKLRQIIQYNPIRFKNYAKRGLVTKKGITEIGKGKEGTVYIGCLDQNCKKEIAIKVANYRELERDQAIMDLIKPHSENVVFPYNLQRCKNGEGFLYMEYFAGGSLFNFLKEHHSDIKSKDIKVIIYQILNAIRQIQARYPTFRHNDLHSENVLINDKFPSTGYSKDGIKNVGIQALLTDFGFANIGNLRRTTKTFKEDWGIAKDNSPLYDVHFFLNAIYAFSNNDSEMKSFIQSILPPEYLGNESRKIKNFRLRYGVDHSKLPPLDQILIHPYFNEIKEVRMPTASPEKKKNKGKQPMIEKTKPKKNNRTFTNKEFQQMVKKFKETGEGPSWLASVVTPVPILPSPARINMHPMNLPKNRPVVVVKPKLLKIQPTKKNNSKVQKFGYVLPKKSNVKLDASDLRKVKELQNEIYEALTNFTNDTQRRNEARKLAIEKVKKNKKPTIVEPKKTTPAPKPAPKPAPSPPKKPAVIKKNLVNEKQKPASPIRKPNKKPLEFKKAPKSQTPKKPTPKPKPKPKPQPKQKRTRKKNIQNALFKVRTNYSLNDKGRVKINKKLCMGYTKPQIQEFLDKEGITYNSKMTKDNLCNLFRNKM